MNDVLKITTSRYGMKEIHFKSDSEFGIRLSRQIQSVDDGTKFLSADEFMSKFGHLLDRKVDDVVRLAEGEDCNERYLMVDEEFLKRHPAKLMFSDEVARNMSVDDQFRAAGLPITDEIIEKAKEFAKIHYGAEPVVRPATDADCSEGFLYLSEHFDELVPDWDEMVKDALAEVSENEPPASYLVGGEFVSTDNPYIVRKDGIAYASDLLKRCVDELSSRPEPTYVSFKDGESSDDFLRRVTEVIKR